MVFVQVGITKFVRIRERKKKMIGTISENLGCWLLPVVGAAYVFNVLGLLFIILVFGVPVLVFVLIVRAVLRNRKENIRLRLEVGKLAGELEQARKKNKTDEENGSSTPSG